MALFIEFFFAILVFRLSKVISAVLIGLMPIQILATIYMVTAPKQIIGAADLGGTNLGPPIVFFLSICGSALVLSCCLIATIVLAIRNRKNL